MTSSDEAVIATNDDASSCKRYAVHVGYWKDDYVQYFVRNLPGRKTPEISRGYFVRVNAVRSVVSQFLAQTSCKCQIVSLGAGFDTLYWMLHEDQTIPQYGYYEIDMKSVTQRKCMAIKGRRQLHGAFPEGGLVIEGNEAHSTVYHLMAADIRNIKEVDLKLTSAGLDKSKPTLFITECVLVYLQASDTRQLFQYMTLNFDTVMLCDYDPVNLNDRFGEVMIQNLRGRQCALLGAQPDVNSKIASLVEGGFDDVKSKLTLELYNELSDEVRTRIDKLEFLDEVDLLYDLLRHYAVSIAYTDKLKHGLECIKA